MTRSLLFLSAYDVLKEGIVALTQVPRPCSVNQIVCCRVRMEHCPLPMILMHQSLSCHVVPATPKLRPGRLIYGRLAGCIMWANLEFQTHSNLFVRLHHLYLSLLILRPRSVFSALYLFMPCNQRPLYSVCFTRGTMSHHVS